MHDEVPVGDRDVERGLPVVVEDGDVGAALVEQQLDDAVVPVRARRVQRVERAARHDFYVISQ